MWNSCLMLVNFFFLNHIWKPSLQPLKSSFSSNFACASHFFVHFFAVTARLRCETVLLHVLWKVKSQDNNFLFLFFKFDNIWQTEWDEISVSSLKQHNSLFKLRFCTVKFDRSGRSFLLVPNRVLLKVNIYKHQTKQTYELHVSTPYEFLILLNQARAYFISISLCLLLMHFFLFRIFSLWTLAISSKMVNFL